MKKLLSKYLYLVAIVGVLLSVGHFASADINNTYWTQPAVNVLDTNTSGGLATAAIHVAACYIGVGTGTPCSEGGGGFSGNLAATQIAFGSGANVISGSNNMTYNSATGLFELQGPTNGTIFAVNDASTSLTFNKSYINIDGVSYDWPASQTAGTLNNDGAGNLTWGAPAAGTITVGTTLVGGGVNTNVLFDNNGVLGGYGVSSTETGSTIAIRNGSGNSGFNNVIQGVNIIISTGGQTTFTAASPYNEIVTGSDSQIIQLPDETTLTAGTSFAIYNQSAEQITVRDSATNPLFYMDSGEGMVYMSMSSASATGNWLLTPLLNENITGSTSTLSTNGNLYVGGHATLEGVTSAGSTGTGNLVFSASPALTGTPTAPTQTTSDSTTKIATDGFVQAAIASGSAGTLTIGTTTITSGTTGTLLYDNSGTLQGVGLPSTDIFVGNGSNLPAPVALSGDATLANTGAITVNTVLGGATPMSIFGNSSLLAQTQNSATTTTYFTSPTTPAATHWYQLTCAMNVTADSLNAGTTTPEIVFTDPHSTTQTIAFGGLPATNTGYQPFGTLVEAKGSTTFTAKVVTTGASGSVTLDVGCGAYLLY